MRGYLGLMIAWYVHTMYVREPDAMQPAPWSLGGPECSRAIDGAGVKVQRS